MLLFFAISYVIICSFHPILYIKSCNFPQWAFLHPSAFFPCSVSAALHRPGCVPGRWITQHCSLQFVTEVHDPRAYLPLARGISYESNFQLGFRTLLLHDVSRQPAVFMLGRGCAVLAHAQPSRGAAHCCIDVQHSMFFTPLDFLVSQLAELPFSGHPVSASSLAAPFPHCNSDWSWQQTFPFLFFHFYQRFWRLTSYICWIQFPQSIAGSHEKMWAEESQADLSIHRRWCFWHVLGIDSVSGNLPFPRGAPQQVALLCLQLCCGAKQLISETLLVA